MRFSFLLAVLFPFVATAQLQFHEQQENQQVLIGKKYKEVFSETIYSEIVKEYVKVPKELKLVSYKIKTTPANYYFTYHFYYGAFRLYNVECKIQVRHSGEIRYLMHNTDFTSLNNVRACDTNLQVSYLPMANEEILSREKVLYYTAAGWQPALIIKIQEKEFKRVTEYIIGNNTELYFVRNSFMEFRDSITAKVFNPDPLTSAHTQFNDQHKDTAFLNSQLQYVRMMGDRVGDSFYLRTDSVYMEDFAAPFIAVPVIVGDTFNKDFNDTLVNYGSVWYHCMRMLQRVKDLGYLGLPDFILRIDPMGFNGGENSEFEPNGNPPWIQLGDGGIPDAQDADVVIHELGHALSNSASTGSIALLERYALDEGLGDYFAVSYTRNIDSFNWQKVFGWEGNTPSWQGRTAAYGAVYPKGGISGGSKWFHGQLWSTAMMRVWDNLGADITDRLMLETLYGLGPSTRMPQAAMLVLESDSALYGGIHTKEIICAFFSNKIWTHDTVVECEFKILPTAFKVLNSMGFAKGDGFVEIVLPDNELAVELIVYDMRGRRIFIRETASNNIFISPYEELKNPGSYFVEIRTRGSKYYRVKLLRSY